MFKKEEVDRAVEATRFLDEFEDQLAKYCKQAARALGWTEITQARLCGKDVEVQVRFDGPYQSHDTGSFQFSIEQLWLATPEQTATELAVIQKSENETRKAKENAEQDRKEALRKSAYEKLSHEEKAALNITTKY